MMVRMCGLVLEHTLMPLEQHIWGFIVIFYGEVYKTRLNTIVVEKYRFLKSKVRFWVVAG